MSDAPIEVVDAELVEDSPPPSKDPVTGAFLPGHSISRPKGSRNKLTSQLLRDYESFLQRFPEASPLEVLARISIGEIYDEEGKKIPVPVSVKMQAAGKLASIIIQPMSVHNKFTANEVSFDQRRLAIDKMLVSTPGARGFMERMAKQIASNMSTTGDSHILTGVVPEDRAAEPVKVP